MSKLKKLGSMLLALVFAIGMTCTALAADITITGAQAGHTYTAYQVFSGTLSDGKLVDIEWGDDVTDSDALLTALKADSTIGSDFTDCTTAEAVANVLEGYNDASEKLMAFAAVVASYVSGGTVLDSSEASDGTYTYSASNLDTGYYLVVDTDDNLASGDAISRYIIQVASSVNIETKTVYPSLEKEVDDTSVEVGQTVNFTLTSTVPDTTGYSVYKYTFSDTMDDGLSFDGTATITVKIGETEVANYTATANTNGFTLVMDMTQYQDYVGQTITITYTATVTEDAVATITTNTATLEYNNNPNNSESTDKITDTEEVYSAQIVIDKYADGDTTDKLAGAKFVLYKYDDEDNILYYAYNETTDTVSWVEDIEDATEVTTDSNGAASFIGLEDGTYYLLETEAPAGYNSLTEAIEVTISGADATATDLSSLTVTEKINNKSGSTLPSTGGMGTTIFYVVGGVLVAGAVVLLITKKRMAE